jgi:hypothetical protein
MVEKITLLREFSSGYVLNGFVKGGSAIFGLYLISRCPVCHFVLG